MSEELSRALADDPEVRRLVSATGPIRSWTVSPEGVEGPYVPTREEWLEGVHDVLRADAELVAAEARVLVESLQKGGTGA